MLFQPSILFIKSITIDSNGNYNYTEPSNAIFVQNSNLATNLTINIGGIYIPSTIDERNIFTNVNNAIRVLNSGIDNDFTIMGNTIDNSDYLYPNASGNFANTAITVQNGRLLSIGNTLINSNTIEGCRIGIHSINNPGIKIGSDLNDDPFPNKIAFNLGSSPAISDYYLGIWLQNCANAYVTGGNNSGEPDIKNDIAVISTGLFNFRGIAIENSPGVRINCNVIENISRSISFTGNCMGSLLRKNYLKEFEIGVDNYSSIIGDQGYNNSSFIWERLDNEWFDIDNDYRIGAGLAVFIDWYYRTTSNQFDPSNNAGGVTPQPSSYGNPVCNDYLPQQRDAIFGDIVGDSIEFEAYIPENNYLVNISAYEEMNKDTSIFNQGRLSDNDFRNFYQSTATTNIGKFVDVAIFSQDTSRLEDAIELNESITDTNSIESNMKIVNDIYLNKVASGIAMSNSDSSDLGDVAALTWIEGGNSIYLAASLLGLEIHPILDNLRMSAYEDFPEINVPNNIIQPVSISVIPNPASNSIEISVDGDQMAHIIIYDMEGKIIFESDQVGTRLIDISSYNFGVYRIEGIFYDGSKQTLKFIKI